MEAIPITDHFGVELVGLDLSRPLAADEVKALRTAFDQGVVLIRGQELDDEAHDRVGRALGPLHRYPWGTTFERMSNIDPTDGSVSGTRELLFHIDGVYGEHVAPATCLYAQTVSDTSTPTLFADSIAAYDALPEEVRNRVDRLHALNTFDVSAAERDVDPSRFRIADHPDAADLPHLRTAVHPAVITAPHTGRRALWVNEFNTSHFVELGPSSDEGEALLQLLFDALYVESNMYAHHYRQHDVIIWNNLIVQHARPGRINEPERTFRRIVISELNW